MDLNDVKGKIYFYLRENLYNSMQSACAEALKKFTGESTLNLYHAVALNLNDRLNESIRQLEQLNGENDIRLATTVALIYSHRKLGTDDQDALGELDGKLREYRRVANASDFCNAAFVLYALGKFDKALDHVEKSLKLRNDDDALALKGWILVKLVYVNSASTTGVLAAFEGLKDNRRNLDYCLGIAEGYVLCKKYDEALSVVNKAIVRFTNTNIPLVYKLKILFSMQDFEPASEVLQRILITNERDYVALKINILLLLIRDSNYAEAALAIDSFIEALGGIEPKNGVLLSEDARLFSRICNRDPQILKLTHKMAEKAIYTDNTNISFLVELGYQCLLQGRSKEASKYYKTASKTDNTSFNALLGLTLCELAENGKSDQIKQQIFFLLELQETPIHPMLLFMRAKLAENTESIIQFLEEACGEQLRPIMNIPYNEEYLKMLDPDFLLDVVKTYLQYAPNAPDILSTKKTSETPNNIITNSLNTLKIITKACPGLEEAQFFLAKVQYLKGDHLDAMKTLNHIINDLDSNSSEAHLLIAQIHLNNGAYERASQSLEVGLSHNFKVRESPLYHLIFGLIERDRKNLDDAIKSFTTALTLINANDQNTEITLADRASIYIELINAHREANQIHEAGKLMEDAMEVFQNTPEEARVMILSAEHAANTGNVQKAIDILSKVSPKESYFLKAKTKLADIFLVNRRDKKAFMACYNEMVQFNPGPESFLLLGDAYMKILEPDKALESYNNALQMNPTDPYLTSKMGKALIDTHYYKKAVVYYKDTIAATDNPELKLQLSDLYMQLKEFDKAQMLLNAEIDNEKAKKADDLISLQYRTRLYKLLSEVLERSGDIKGATEGLKAARDNQNRVRKILSIEQTVIPEAETECLVQLNMKLSELASSVRENEKAINYYKDALAVSSDNPKILAALAKLYMQMHYLELCQQTCTTLLNIDPDNEVASVLMADIAFRKIDFDMSVFHFTQLVNKQPTNWHALVRLVEVMRRTGNIDLIPQYFQRAEEFCDRPTKEAGLSYCIALYQWYTGNLNGALRNFNNARQDPEWGQEAIYNMIEICLNPEDDMLGDQFIDADDYEYRDSRSMALKTAERLLRELKQKCSSLCEESLKCRLLGNFLLLASKEKYNIEAALEDFISIASQDAYKDHIGPILGVATAYTMLKQAQRAKTQLKRIIKSVWTFEDAEYLERCWLLLADYYIQSNKYDLGIDLLKKVLQHNKACSKAYEYYGFVCEKEQKYREAASYYESAWKYNGKNNPGIGYKLAYNLMKCKRYAEAIDIGQQVLKNHPDYGRVKKDILDKSVSNLRTVSAKPRAGDESFGMRPAAKDRKNWRSSDPFDSLIETMFRSKRNSYPSVSWAGSDVLIKVHNLDEDIEQEERDGQ